MRERRDVNGPVEPSPSDRPLVPAAAPFDRLAELVARAERAGIVDANAATLSTVDERGRPSSRVILLKEIDPRGLVLYTNLESRKGRQIQGSPWVALSLFWRELGAQVHAEGRAEPVSPQEADAYFATRPRASQLGAWASRQSRPLPSRARLLADVARFEARFLGRPVPRPLHWAGLRVVPERFEFWRAAPFRLHHRELYLRAPGGWHTERLYP